RLEQLVHLRPGRSHVARLPVHDQRLRHTLGDRHPRVEARRGILENEPQTRPDGAQRLALHAPQLHAEHVQRTTTDPGQPCDGPVYSACGGASRVGRSACPTIRPWYITATGAARSATTPVLCVIRMIEVPNSSRQRRSRSRISACTVTSSAVVGSSAMITPGS